MNGTHWDVVKSGDPIIGGWLRCGGSCCWLCVMLKRISLVMPLKPGPAATGTWGGRDGGGNDRLWELMNPLTNVNVLCVGKRWPGHTNG